MKFPNGNFIFYMNIAYLYNQKKQHYSLKKPNPTKNNY